MRRVASSVLNKMDEVQMECFRMFVALGRKRSLSKLFEATTALNMNVSLRKLRRWQNVYKWTELAQESAAAIADKVQEEMQPVLVDHAKRQIEMLHKLQDRFYERLALNPNDPNLTPEQRTRAIDPDFKEFAESVKLERLILGDATERHEDVKTSRVVVEFTPSELFSAAQQIAEKRYGLPPALTTIEHDE